MPVGVRLKVKIVVTFLLHPRYLSSQDNSINAIDWTVGAKEYSLLTHAISIYFLMNKV